MHELPDAELLRRYAEQNSEEAFTALVQRYLNIVYSAALRKTRNANAADEIAQAVFIILAKKAARLGEDAALSGWLYQTTRLTAQNYIRSEMRRVHREQEAAYMQSLTAEADSHLWPQIERHLEDAMGELGQKDRNALAMRFFESKTFQDVGVALGDSENAAKKRVARALEKLRKCFLKRGVVSNAVIIASAISANSVQAAPAGLAGSISSGALAGGAAASTSSFHLANGTLEIMTWAKMKTALVVGCAFIAVGGGAVVASRDAFPKREAGRILERVRKTYGALSTYTSSGTTVQEIGTNTSSTITGTFTVHLGRPNLYRIEYE